MYVFRLSLALTQVVLIQSIINMIKYNIGKYIKSYLQRLVAWLIWKCAGLDRFTIRRTRLLLGWVIVCGGRRRINNISV